MGKCKQKGGYNAVIKNPIGKNRIKGQDFVTFNSRIRIINVMDNAGKVHTFMAPSKSRKPVKSLVWVTPNERTLTVRSFNEGMGYAWFRNEIEDLLNKGETMDNIKKMVAKAIIDNGNHLPIRKDLPKGSVSVLSNGSRRKRNAERRVLGMTGKAYRKHEKRERRKASE